MFLFNLFGPPAGRVCHTGYTNHENYKKTKRKKSICSAPFQGHFATPVIKIMENNQKMFCSICSAPWQGSFCHTGDGDGDGGNQKGQIFVPQPNRTGYNRISLFFIHIIILFGYVIYSLYTFVYIYVHFYIFMDFN